PNGATRRERARMTEAKSRARLAVIGAIVLALFGGLLTRLWFLQVAGGERLAVQAQNNRDRLVETAAVRGRIPEPRGGALAEDKVVDSITVDRQRLVGATRAAVASRLGALLGIDAVDILRRIDDPKYSPYRPVPVAVNITFDRVLELEEHLDQYPGVAISRVTVRNYPYGAATAHVVGYVGKISSSDLKAHAPHAYPPHDLTRK